MLEAGDPGLERLVFFAEWLERLRHLTQVVLGDATKELLASGERSRWA